MKLKVTPQSVLLKAKSVMELDEIILLLWFY